MYIYTCIKQRVAQFADLQISVFGVLGWGLEFGVWEFMCWFYICEKIFYYALCTFDIRIDLKHMIIPSVWRSKGVRPGIEWGCFGEGRARLSEYKSSRWVFQGSGIGTQGPRLRQIKVGHINMEIMRGAINWVLFARVPTGLYWREVVRGSDEKQSLSPSNKSL